MKVPSTEVQNNFGKFLKYVEADEEIIITKNGHNVAKILPYSDSDLLREEAFDYRTGENWVTYEEFIELAEASEQRFELIDGVIYNMAAPSYDHQYAVHEIHGTFYNWFKNKKCVPLTSPFDVTFFKSEDNICVVQPDIIVVCDSEKQNEKGRYQGIPTLVIEVLSLSTRSKDMIKKLDLYKQCGVKEYWMVDTKKNMIYVYTFDNKDITDYIVYQKGIQEFAESICFEGLKVNLKDVFL